MSSTHGVRNAIDAEAAMDIEATERLEVEPWMRNLAAQLAPPMRPAIQLEPGDWIDHYQIKATLGRGGFGIVYRAYDRIAERDVALKLIWREVSGTNGDRFAEAIVAAKLEHENIVRCYAASQWRGHRYLTFECLEGETLEAALSRGRLGLADALRISLQVADALAYAHCMGIVHGDLKPANVFLARTDKAKLLDFGLATSLADDSLAAPIGGTPGFIAPERARGHCDMRSDVFAAGMLLYVSLTGAIPFSMTALSGAGSKGPAAIDASRVAAPPWLRKLLVTATAADPARRPQTAVQWRDQLAGQSRAWGRWRAVAFATLIPSALLVMVGVARHLNEGPNRVMGPSLSPDSTNAMPPARELSPNERIQTAPAVPAGSLLKALDTTVASGSFLVHLQRATLQSSRDGSASLAVDFRAENRSDRAQTPFADLLERFEGAKSLRLLLGGRTYYGEIVTSGLVPKLGAGTGKISWTLADQMSSPTLLQRAVIELGSAKVNQARISLAEPQETVALVDWPIRVADVRPVQSRSTLIEFRNAYISFNNRANNVPLPAGTAWLVIEVTMTTDRDFVYWDGRDNNSLRRPDGVSVAWHDLGGAFMLSKDKSQDVALCFDVVPPLSGEYVVAFGPGSPGEIRTLQVSPP